MEVMCRDRYGEFPTEVFSLWTCSFCYVYLFQWGNKLMVNQNRTHPRLVDRTRGVDYLPDVQNQTARNQICDYLTDEECGRWTTCCLEATACCGEQVSALFRNTASEDINSEGISCPATWDGVSCIEATPAGSRADVPCPAFFTPQHNPTAMASKECTEDGTWYKHPSANQEWTDYTSCFQ